MKIRIICKQEQDISIDSVSKNSYYVIITIQDLLMANQENKLSDFLLSLNEKLDLIYEISSILKKTNFEVLKTDENIQLLLDKVTALEGKVFNKLKNFVDIVKEQEKRIQRLEQFLYYNSYSKN